MCEIFSMIGASIAAAASATASAVGTAGGAIGGALSSALSSISGAIGGGTAGGATAAGVEGAVASGGFAGAGEAAVAGGEAALAGTEGALSATEAATLNSFADATITSQTASGSTLGGLASKALTAAGVGASLASGFLMSGKDTTGIQNTTGSTITQGASMNEKVAETATYAKNHSLRKRTLSSLRVPLNKVADNVGLNTGSSKSKGGTSSGGNIGMNIPT